MKKIAYFTVMGVLLMLITNNIYAQENKVTPKWSVTSHLGAVFALKYNYGVVYGQVGFRVWGWHVIGGSFGAGAVAIGNEIDKNIRGEAILENSSGIYYTGFYGLQTPYFYMTNGMPNISGRAELHFGIQKDGFGTRPISFIRVVIQYIPFILGMSFDYVLLSPAPASINGWSIENTSKFKVGISLLALQF